MTESLDWLTAGRDTPLHHPCGLGWAVIGAWWASAAVAGVVVAVVVDRLLGRPS